MPIHTIHDISSVPVGGKLIRDLAGLHLTVYVHAKAGNLVFTAPFPTTKGCQRKDFSFENWGWWIFEANTGVELDDLIGPTAVSVARPDPDE